MTAIYVATTGSDDNPGSKSNPLATIATADAITPTARVENCMLA
jgi:hypothetical protein